MDDLLAARWQMAVSLGFHIIFACVGMVMPFFMARAQWRWLRTGEPVYRELARAWAKGVAVFFAVGAVSGTVLSFELGLLWPEFMRHAGPIFGMPFSLEGAAFFLEAIALGFFLFGEGRIPVRAHFASGIVVGVAGVLSGILVIAANSWMNSPVGFDWIDGKATNVRPWAAMFNPAWFHQAHHMVIAAFSATGFAVAGLHALQLLRHPHSEFHQAAIRVALPFAVIASLIQPLGGDLLARQVAKLQPAKLAALEGHFETGPYAPLRLGGIPNEATREVPFAINIPGGLSLLVHHDPAAEVTGLDAFPEEEWPPVAITHISFQVMVFCGMVLAAISFFWLFAVFKRRAWLDHPLFLKALVLCVPLGYIAIEAGWTVTEVGRQPWIIYGIMRTDESLTPMPGVGYFFVVITAVYLVLAVLVTMLMTWLIQDANARYSKGGGSNS